MPLQGVYAPTGVACGRITHPKHPNLYSFSFMPNTLPGIGDAGGAVGFPFI
jgi:hypothetical protein